MAKTAKALREEQEKLETTMRQHRDKITGDTYKYDKADEDAWTRMNDEHNQRAALIRQIEAADDILKVREEGKDARDKLKTERSKKSHRSNPGDPATPAERQEAATGYILRFVLGLGNLVTEQMRGSMVKAKRQGLIGVGKRGLEIKLSRAADLKEQQRALAFGAGAGNAGVLGPDGFIAALERNMLAYGQVAQVCTILRTDNGRKIDAPYADDTANEGDIVGEAAAVSAAQDPTLGEQSWGAFKIRSKKIIFSSEAEEDSVFDLPTLLGEMCGERIGRGQNRYMTTGTGSGQHEGVVVGSALGVTAALTTAFTADELINLEHSVDVAYRTAAAYMLHDTILAFVRKLKYAGTGEYIYDFGKGGQATINGRQVQVNNHMASALTTGQKLVLFGDFKKIILRQVNNVRLRRYLELHADNDQEAVQAFLRSDSKIQNTGTPPIRHLKLA